MFNISLSRWILHISFIVVYAALILYGISEDELPMSLATVGVMGFFHSLITYYLYE